MFLSVLLPNFDQTFTMHRFKRLREIAAFPSPAALAALEMPGIFQGTIAFKLCSVHSPHQTSRSVSGKAVLRS